MTTHGPYGSIPDNGGGILNSFEAFCETVNRECGGSVVKVVLDKVSFDALKSYMLSQHIPFFKERIKDSGDFFIVTVRGKVEISMADNYLKQTEKL